MYTLICKNCGEKFSVKFKSELKRRFCSISCHVSCRNRQGKNSNVKKECLNCNKQFEVEYSFRKQKFCGKSCQVSYRNKHCSRGVVIFETNCLICDKEIIYEKGERKRKFCCRKCFGKYRSKNRLLLQWKGGYFCFTKCLYCNKWFENRVDFFGKLLRTYCSNKCSVVYRNKQNTWSRLFSGLESIPGARSAHANEHLHKL